MSVRAALVDTSRHQGDVRPADLKAAGVVGIIARCTVGWGGPNQPDPLYLQTQQRTRDAGLIFGAYHVLWPENEDPKREAVAFVDKIGDVDMIVLDAELRQSLTPQNIVDQCHEWLEETERLSGMRPVVYTGSWFWDGDGHIGPATPAGWERVYALWEAEYTHNFPRGGVDLSQAPTGDPSDLSDGFPGWSFWQWTSSGRPIGVNSASLDYNIFNGDEKALREALGLGSSPSAPSEKLPVVLEIPRGKINVTIREV